MLDERQILNLVANEMSDSIGGSENDSVESDRRAALAAYLGQPNGKEVEGRSSVVSTDVADAIEWILPEIVKAFTQNNEVVTFDPAYDGDEDQAELESQYVYDILMKDNDGFIIIHQLVKDALMQKNGIVKTFYEDADEERTESYTGLTEIELKMILSNPDAELLTLTEIEGEIPTFDVSVKIIDRKSKVAVISVPPEEFRVNKDHNSISLENARFTSHVMEKTAGDLIAMGHSKDLIDSVPSSENSIGTYGDTDYRFYLQGENTALTNSMDPALRPIEVSESFMRIDLNEDGIAEYVKITTAGGDLGVLLDTEEVDSNPFNAATAILMSHKFLGLSMHDRLIQIQEQKTSLWRNILDNMYLQNNQRTIVVENQVNLDDLLVSRPGGIIRVKRPDAVIPYQTPALPSDAYRMLDYLDQVRAGRAGVSPEGAVQDSQIGDRIGSEGLERMMSQKEELVGLMIRVIAETGIKPICYKIREEVQKHQDVAKDYMFRGQWVSVNPMHWRNRSHSTVRVGTGSGNRQLQANALTQIMAMQEKVLANPSQSLVTEEQVFDTINDFIKLSGFPSARRYFLDPKSPQGQENKKAVQESNAKAQEASKQQEMALTKAQLQVAEAETKKAEANMLNVQLKNEIDTMKNDIDMAAKSTDYVEEQLKLQLKEAEMLLARDGKSEDLEFKYWDAGQRHDIEKERVDVQRMAQENKPNE